MKKLFFTLLLATLVAVPLTSPVLAGFGFDSTLDNVADQAGYNSSSSQTLDERISSFISIFLSFLGVIFLVLMLYGGYNWMTAAGDEKKVDKAKDTIKAALIGIIIVAAAYGISIFVISRVWAAPLSLLAPQTAYAQTNTITPSTTPLLNRLQNVGTGAGYSDATETTLFDIVGMIVNAFLALLGAIFIILICVAGYNWMTASGDEEKITKAKDTIRASIIGLIIIVGAYAIWNFVVTYLIVGNS